MSATSIKTFHLDLKFYNCVSPGRAMPEVFCNTLLLLGISVVIAYDPRFVYRFHCVLV